MQMHCRDDESLFQSLSPSASWKNFRVAVSQHEFREFVDMETHKVLLDKSCSLIWSSRCSRCKNLLESTLSSSCVVVSHGKLACLSSRLWPRNTRDIFLTCNQALILKIVCSSCCCDDDVLSRTLQETRKEAICVTCCTSRVCLAISSFLFCSSSHNICRWRLRRRQWT